MLPANLVQALERLSERGLDISHLFDPEHWSPLDRAELLPGIPIARPDPLGLLIGNTHALWGHLAQIPDLDQLGDPVDEIVEHEVKGALGQLEVLGLFFSHQTRPRPLPFVRLAERTGLAQKGPCELAVHPRYGPWFSPRAVVLFDLPGRLAPCPTRARPCDGCQAPCVLPFRVALAATGASGGRNRAGVNWHHKAWIAARDACPVGREHRYPPDQLDYHYTGNRGALP